MNCPNASFCKNYRHFQNRAGQTNCSLICSHNPLPDRLNFLVDNRQAVQLPPQQPTEQQQFDNVHDSSRYNIPADSFDKDPNDGLVDVTIEHGTAEEKAAGTLLRDVGQGASLQETMAQMNKHSQAHDSQTQATRNVVGEQSIMAQNASLPPPVALPEEQVVTQPPPASVPVERGQKQCPACQGTFKNLHSHLRMSKCGRELNAPSV